MHGTMSLKKWNTVFKIQKLYFFPPLYIYAPPPRFSHQNIGGNKPFPSHVTANKQIHTQIANSSLNFCFKQKFTFSGNTFQQLNIHACYMQLSFVLPSICTTPPINLILHGPTFQQPANKWHFCTFTWCTLSLKQYQQSKDCHGWVMSCGGQFAVITSIPFKL